ncbi:unnamed protein product [Durusdinium trenchii]
MNPQELSNSFWASARLKDVVPDVAQIVPALSVQIPGNAGAMNTQELSNCFWAAGKLKDVALDSVRQILPALVARLPNAVPDMIPQHFAQCFSAVELLKDLEPDVLKLLPALRAEVAKRGLSEAKLSGSGTVK